MPISPMKKSRTHEKYRMKSGDPDTVKKVKINDREIDVVSATDDHIQYTIPADMPEGQYRISFINAENQSFGGGIVNISGQAIVTESSFISALPGQLTLSGRKLDGVSAVTVNGQTCTIVSQQADKMVVELPALADGNYTMKATTTKGASTGHNHTYQRGFQFQGRAFMAHSSSTISRAFLTIDFTGSNSISEPMQ